MVCQIWNFLSCLRSFCSIKVVTFKNNWNGNYCRPITKCSVHQNVKSSIDCQLCSKVYFSPFLLHFIAIVYYSKMFLCSCLIVKMCLHKSPKTKKNKKQTFLILTFLFPNIVMQFHCKWSISLINSGDQSELY